MSDYFVSDFTAIGAVKKKTSKVISGNKLDLAGNYF